MTGLLPKLIVGLDGVVVALAAWIAVCFAGLGRRGLVEVTLGWLLLALAWIAGSGVLLGSVGGLGRMGFLAIHVAGLAALLLVRRRWREDVRLGGEWLGAWGRLLRSNTPEGWITGGLAVVVLGLAVLAAQAEPIIYDALTYRLSRIGVWLQDGWIRHIPSDDPRLNYMPVAPDLMLAWLLGATDAGFRPVALGQMAGGLLLLGATFGLARSAGLSRLAALGAVALVLGMANVAVQFTTVQSDLFTAGIFAAAYLLWHRALERGEGSWVAGIGVALAFASKGTMFYLAPGAALWAGWHVWRHRQHWRALGPSLMGGVAAALILVVPGWWRNVAAYGTWSGPREAVVLHHGDFASPAHYPEKMLRNLGSSAVQLFEPTAQPFWLQETSRAAGVVLAARQPAQADDYVFIGLARREQLERVMRLTEPDADVVTCGLLAAGMFLVGLLTAGLGWRSQPGAPQVSVWGAGVAVYLMMQHALVQWHFWEFRFLVIAAPWMAVVGAWAVGRWPRMLRVAAWTVLVAAAAEIFFGVQARTSQAAWQAVERPMRSASFYNYNHWRAWVARLDQPQEALRAAFPINNPLAAFFRHERPRHVTIESFARLPGATAEDALGGFTGWLVVPLEHFMGREGRVMGRTGLFNLAAYRRLQPGETPRPLVYTNQPLAADGVWRHELVLRTWSDAPVRLELTNPGGEARQFGVISPTDRRAGEIPAGGRLILEVAVPSDVLAVVTVDFAKPAGAEELAVPAVRLAP